VTFHFFILLLLSTEGGGRVAAPADLLRNPPRGRFPGLPLLEGGYFGLYMVSLLPFLLLIASHRKSFPKGTRFRNHASGFGGYFESANMRQSSGHFLYSVNALESCTQIIYFDFKYQGFF
jgi:hypothetical protein